MPDPGMSSAIYSPGLAVITTGTAAMFPAGMITFTSDPTCAQLPPDNVRRTILIVFEVPLLLKARTAKPLTVPRPGNGVLMIYRPAEMLVPVTGGVALGRPMVEGA